MVTCPTVSLQVDDFKLYLHNSATGAHVAGQVCKGLHWVAGPYSLFGPEEQQRYTVPESLAQLRVTDGAWLQAAVLALKLWAQAACWCSPSVKPCSQNLSGGLGAQGAQPVVLTSRRMTVWQSQLSA
jgi:hypothetical protein